jgi:hypothetical protein
MNILFSLVVYLFMINEYEILPVPQLEEKLKQESRDVFDYDVQLRHSGAFVYYLQSEQVILMPNSLWDKERGIIFKDRKVFDSYAALEKFPIENFNRSIEEMFQPEILGVGEDIPKLLSDISALYALDSGSQDLSKILIKAQERSGLTELPNKEYMNASLLLGEYLRRTIGGKWILLKQYGTFNPFYIPAIINGQNSIILLMNVVDLYFIGDLSLDNFVKLSSQEPVVIFGNASFNIAYPQYKLVH